MTRIFGSNSQAGDWMLSPFIEDDSEKLSEVKSKIDDSEVVQARTEMERCQASGEKFYYGEDTSEAVKRELSEYAEVIGMSDIEQVSSDRVSMSKAAEGLKVRPEPVVETPDPIFDIMPQPASDPSVFASNDSWRDIEAGKAKLINSRPSGDGIAPIRGGEEYEIDPVKTIRPGENSIDDPGAIDAIASSEEKTSLQAIREANERRRNETTFDRDDWQSGKLDEMDHSSIVPKGGARQVEYPSAQNHSSTGAWNNSIVADPDSDPMPDKTSGEQIADLNSRRQAEISRETVSDDWEKMESSVSEKVGDIFIENLERNLKNLDNG